MNNYEKPIAFFSDGEGEGVFAASGNAGAATCWSISYQPEGGGGNEGDWQWKNYHFFGKHSNAVQHISTGCSFRVTFSKEVRKAQFEGFKATKITDTCWEFSRGQHANAYASGDNFGTLVQILVKDRNHVDIISIDHIKCEKKVNVQGGGADGN